jgi:hypothetical protein
MKKIIISSLVFIFCLALVPNALASVAEGQTCDPTKSNVCAAGLSCSGTGTSGTCKKDTFGLNPVNAGVGGTLGNKDLRTVIGNIINVALSLLGVVAVVIILIGGFKWMTAGGSEDKVEEAKKMIFQGIIGLAIILSAWAIAIFVLNSLSSATSSGSVPTF